MSSATGQKWEGRWDQLKGRVREAWGVVTDDEMDQFKGDYEQLIGRLKERTGETREAIERRLNQEEFATRR
jgi:uncharacterized protein YjbJ (UPF0337 family)